MDDFIQDQGTPFFAHMLRRLADELVDGASLFYRENGITAPARTASTLLLLAEAGPSTVTGIAARLRQSHPLVITWVRQLRSLDFVATEQDARDGRRTLVSLTPAGAAETKRMRRALQQLGKAYERLFAEVGCDAHRIVVQLYEASRQPTFAERLGREAAAAVAAGAAG
jgi:DNA-binding MarR family transcriptional regulator